MMRYSRMPRDAAGWTLMVALITAMGVQGAEGPSATAHRILQETGVRGGLVVQLGCGDGVLTTALRINDSYLVHGLDTDAAAVAEARRRIRSQGVYGPVSVDTFDGRRLPYAENLVNLLVAEDLRDVPMAEVLRVLVPRGVAYVKQGGAWTKTVKPWPDDIDEWTHYLHGADGNPVARDRRVGPPRSVQWVASPLWSKSHSAIPSMVALVSAGGRIFYIADTGPTGIAAPDGSLEDWRVCARDAFNGHLLWERSLSDWGSRAWSPGDGVSPGGSGPWIGNPRNIHKRMVTSGDSVFVTLGFRAPVSRLDAATGEVLATYTGTEYATEMVLAGDTLFLGVDAAARAAGKYANAPEKTVVAVNTKTGKCLWRKDRFRGVEDKKRRKLDGKLTRLSLTIGGGQVFVYEGDTVVALDAGTGDERWRSPVPLPEGARKPPSKNKHWWAPHDEDQGELMYSDGVLYCWRPHNRAGWRMETELAALSIDDGRKLWNTTCSISTFAALEHAGIFKAQGLIWVNSKMPDQLLCGLDPESGNVVKTHDLTECMGTIHHNRCHRAKATENYLIYSRNGVELVDFATGRMSATHWIRGICAYGIMPANGLIYTPPQACSCFPSVRAGGFVAYGPKRTASPDHDIPDGERLRRGELFSHALGKQAGSIPWGMYRRDALRSGATDERVGSNLAAGWESDLSEPVTAPTVGLGKVFMAGRRTCQVHALDIRTGRRTWTFSADGMVDTPPTIRDGSVYFGTRHGVIYRLRASDGRMCWRFDANPSRRLVMVHGRLESAWPVFGSVVVEDGVVYAAAGRSSYLDGGLHVYAVDAATGDILRYFNHCSTSDVAFAEKRWAERPSRIEGWNERTAIGTRNDIYITNKSRKWFLISGGQNDLLTLDESGLHIKNFSLAPATFAPRYQHWPYTGARAGTEERVPGGVMRSVVGGFLDDSLFSRSGYVLDEKLKARLMVFDDNTMYAFGWGKKGTTFAFGGLLNTDEDRYRITAHARTKESDSQRTTDKPLWNLEHYYINEQLQNLMIEKRKLDKKRKSKMPEKKTLERLKFLEMHEKKMLKRLNQPNLKGVDKGKAIWSLDIPIRVQAMALAGKTLFIAGCPFDPAAPRDLLEGTRGEGPGVLWAIDRERGTKLAEIPLSAPPVWDGLAVADGSLFVSLQSGKLARMAQRTSPSSRNGQ